MWIDKIRWNNRTNWTEKIRWNNKTLFNNKTLNLKDYCSNKSITENINNGSPIFGNTLLTITAGSFGIISFIMSLYVAWHCWLRDQLQEMVLEYCFCGLGEYILSCWEFFGFISNWREREEERQDLDDIGIPMKYRHVGLTEHQIGEIKRAEQINKIRLKEAIKINWDELKKTAVRIEIPNCKPRPKPLQEIVETHEEEYAVKDDSPSGTPRRRRALI